MDKKINNILKKENTLQEGVEYTGEITFYKKNKYGFIDSGDNNPDIFFLLDNIPDKIKSKIKVGSQLCFRLKDGKNKDEAYDIEIAS
ncbi:MAG: cold-shock protein [Nanoarchaeota archaeon]